MTAVSCRQAPLCCGPFTAGETPDPLRYRFLDGAGDPIDLTGADAAFCFAERWGGVKTGPATVDAAAGAVTYSWAAGDLADPGRYTGHFWVELDDGRVFASLPIRFDVLFPACRRVA
jgi:BppU N-terminal domain